jgi:hypothetical protein
MPSFVQQVATAPATFKVVGNNVVLSVKAPARSVVHIYRDGVLVKTVPASAARAIKISGNKVGISSFQVIVVDIAGKITTSGTRSARATTPIPGSNRLTNPKIGSQLPAEVLAVASSPASSKVMGNNVVLNVRAPALSVVHIYRDGVLVKTVPAAAARAIKITKNRVGNSSFQVVVVDKAGKMTITGKRTVRVQKASK